MQMLKITNTRDVRFDWCTKMQSVVENTHERLVSNITHHYQHSQKPKARKYQLPIADAVCGDCGPHYNQDYFQALRSLETLTF